MRSRVLHLEAPAKINLFLRVLAREASGHHSVETLYAAVDLADRLHLELEPKGGVELEVAAAQDLGPLNDNLVHRAAAAFLEEAGVSEGVRIRLDKVIPAGAGLGGGSSDAAATLKGLNHLLRSPLDRDRLIEIAGELGADVAFFLSPQPLALGWSRGDRLLPMDPLPQRPVVLALPALEVDTAAAYRTLARERAEAREAPPAARILDPTLLGAWERVAEIAANDFEELVYRKHPLLTRIRDAVEETRPVLTLLAGSGAGLFAVYSGDKLAHEARTRLAEEFPDVRFVVSQTLRAFPDSRPESQGTPPSSQPVGLEGPEGPA